MTMYNDIFILHRNEFGIAFMWKKPEVITKEKVQIIFRDIGFYLTIDEVKHFSKCIAETKLKSLGCGCAIPGDSRSLLLRTPSAKIDIAVSEEELTAIEDLVKGALFRVALEKYLAEGCKN